MTATCRACLLDSSPSITFPFSDPKILKLYQDCTGIAVSVYDPFPQQICSQCRIKCMDWKYFRSMATGSENRLNTEEQEEIQSVTIEEDQEIESQFEDYGMDENTTGQAEYEHSADEEDDMAQGEEDDEAEEESRLAGSRSEEEQVRDRLPLPPPFKLETRKMRLIPVNEEEFQKYRLEMEQYRPRFDDMVKRLVVRVGYNSTVLPKDRYDTLVTKLKLLKEGVVKKVGTDYSRLRTYDLITEENGMERLVSHAAREKNSVSKLYVHTGEYFDLLRDAHARMGHVGRAKLHEYVTKRYKNVTCQVIMVFLAVCPRCNRKSKIRAKEALETILPSQGEKGTMEVRE